MMEKKDKLWVEDPVPPEYENCDKCSLSLQRSKVIWGEGNPEASIFVVLDNPGAREDKAGKPLVCGTRETLYSAISEVGLTKEHLYITYLLRCRPVRKYDKRQARSACIKYLWDQLAFKDPKLVVCLGNVVAQWYLGNDEAVIKELRGRVSCHNGTATAFSYHPLAVRRRPGLLKPFLEDWRIIASFFYNKT